MLQNLTTLHLAGSTNFDSEGSVNILAQILETAPNLKICNIIGQTGVRKIHVEVTYAERRGTEDSPGEIKVY